MTKRKLSPLFVHRSSCGQLSDLFPTDDLDHHWGAPTPQPVTHLHRRPPPITSSHINDCNSIAEWQKATSVGSKLGGGQINDSHFIVDEQARRLKAPLNANVILWRFARDRCQWHVPSHFGKTVSVTACQMPMGSRLN